MKASYIKNLLAIFLVMVVNLTMAQPQPKANDDAARTTINEAVLLDLLANDEAVNKESTTVEILEAEGINGKLESKLTKGLYTYKPKKGFVGKEAIIYRICNGEKNCDEAVLTITVVPNKPEASDDIVVIDNKALQLNIEVLNNDKYSTKFASLSIEATPQSGSVVVNDDNTITYYVGAEGSNIEDKFSYKLCHLTECSVASVSIQSDIRVGNAISPNGDGRNDFFVIQGLDQYEQAKLQIFDRFGTPLWFSAPKYDNSWNGTNLAGEMLPGGTYYYQLELSNTSDVKAKVKSGFLVINRNN